MEPYFVNHLVDTLSKELSKSKGDFSEDSRLPLNSIVAERKVEEGRQR